MKIQKGVVTAAGWGTRFLPATKAQPKEMLPLVDKPIIQYVVEEAVAAGIEQIIIITALGKRAIEDHFDRSLELESALAQKGDEKRLAEVRRISELANICYVRQKEQLGLGHAILAARYVVGDEPFALFLPDDVIESEKPCIRQLMDIYDRYKCSVVAVEPVPGPETSRYGIIQPQPIAPRLYQVADLVEKPAPTEAPSNLAVVGRYVLTPEVFPALEQTLPGSGGEIQLTDGLRLLLQRQAIYAYQFEGTRYDTGVPLGFLKASVAMALKRPDLQDNLRGYLRSLAEEAPALADPPPRRRHRAKSA